jgi:energy-converting hydrogenase A subunit M
MAAADVKLAESELERIERWRAQALERAGYAADAAHEIAARLDIDLHEAIDLVKAGCPPEIAVRILV